MTTRTESGRTALVLVDLQNDYFEGGRMALPGAEQAGKKAAWLLRACRERGIPVVHVRHESVRPGSTFFLPGTPGAEIHGDLSPLAGEPVLTKHFPNSFRETGLEELLRGKGVERLIVAGMMTNMCIDATVRAAFDLGFSCQVAHDACAACPLAFGGVAVGAAEVHAAFLAALGMVYAGIEDVAGLLGGIRD